MQALNDNLRLAKESEDQKKEIEELKNKIAQLEKDLG